MNDKVYCRHYGTTITPTGCIKRQFPRQQRNRFRMPWDVMCMSGHCKQGQEILALHGDKREPAPAATGAKPKEGGSTKWMPTPRKKEDGRVVKTCSKCKTEHVIEDFYKRRGCVDNRDPICRFCRLAALKAKRDAARQAAASNSL